MQPCFDFRNRFSCDICVDLQPIPGPQEKRSFSGQFKYKVQSFGSCICLCGNWHHAFIHSFCASARISWSSRVVKDTIDRLN